MSDGESDGGGGGHVADGPVTAAVADAAGPVTAAVADTTRQDLLVDAARRLGPADDLADLDDDAIAAAVATGAAELAAATARWLGVLAELVVRGVWARDGATSPATWLSWACGIGASTAREHVRVAVRLRECPLVAERFAAGRLSYSKVRAITRICTPQIEPMLVAWADGAPAAVLERIVASARQVQRAADAPADRDDLGARSRWLDDGTYELRLRVDAATGVAVEQHLDRLTDLAEHAGDGALSDDRGARDHAQATHDEDHGDRSREAPARPTRARRRADALVGALAASVAAGPSDGSGADRHTVVLHVPADALLADDAEPTTTAVAATTVTSTPVTSTPVTSTPVTSTPVTSTPVAAGAAAGADPAPGSTDTAAVGATATAGSAERASTPGRPDPTRPATAASDGAPPAAPDPKRRTAAALVRDGRGRVRAMSTRQLRRLACSPRLLVTVVGDGTARDLGRSRREPNARLRRLLLARDRTCRFPGCGTTQHLHAHHVVWWSAGGATDLDNLVLLCRHHHAVVHDDGWRLRAAGRGRWTFHPPPGHPAADDGPWPARREGAGASAEAVALAAAVHAPDISPVSLRPPHWDGTPHDHDMAVGVLLERAAA